MASRRDKITVTKIETRGDKSEKNATSGRKRVKITEVETATPSRQATDPKRTALATALGMPVTAAGVSNQDYIQPPESVEDAYRTYRLSPALEPIIRAHIVNVYTAPFTFEPTVDLGATDILDKIKLALSYEKAAGASEAETDLEKMFEAEAAVSDEEAKKELDRLKTRAARERLFLEAWFAAASPDYSYHMLRAYLGQDKHIMGSAYWEVLRTGGYPMRLYWVPSWSVRAAPSQQEQYALEAPVRKTWLRWGTATQVRRFRQYVQLTLNGQVATRYKEYGDPRVLSRNSGKYYDSLEEMHAAEDVPELDTFGKQKIDADGKPIFKERAVLATELLSFQIPFSGNAAYGKPKWTGTYPQHMGTRDLAEQNRNTVTDSVVPSMLIFIGGMRASDADVTRMEQSFKSREPGAPLVQVIRAYNQRSAPQGPSQTLQVHVEKLRDVQHTDGLGMNYLKQSDKEMRRPYGMPKVCLGDDEGVNKATAFSMFQYTEGQVYDPERADLDDRINSTILTDLRILCWRYKTLTRTPKDPELLASIISKLMAASVLTPDEGREQTGQIFNTDLPDLPGIWSKMPTGLVTALLQTKNQATAAALLAAEGGEFLSQLQATILGELAEKQAAAAAVGPIGPAGPEGPNVKQAQQDQSQQDKVKVKDKKGKNDERAAARPPGPPKASEAT
jgi:capsid portal protein